MKIMVDINDFEQEKTCTYKDEIYSVRDNGAIMRHIREGKPKRKNDNLWTFGKPNLISGYLEFAGERVHRIVAYAFLGDPPTDQHVVDHIDTNRQNNRPENLRWLTKLENVLLNEITRKKIEYICGSIEAFLQNPSLLRGHESEDPNFSWMRTVTKEEAENTLRNWKNLMERPKIDQGNSGQIGEWIFGNNTLSTPVGAPMSHISEQAHNDIIFPVNNTSNDILQLEEDDYFNEQRQKKAKPKEEEKRKLIKTVKEAIISIANSHNWIIEKNAVGNGWRADLVIKSPNKSVGFMLYKSTRNIKEKQAAMSADGIYACWLGSKYIDYIDNDLYPYFEIGIQDDLIMVKESKCERVSLEDLILAIMDNRLDIEDTLTVDKLKIRFEPINCYSCGYKHYLYFVIGAISKKYPTLASCEGLSELQVSVDEFDPIVISSVKRYLENHPELNYPMGEIKNRYSNTRDEEYISFGCPKCDGLVGDHYYGNIYNEIIYESDDENVHVIDLDEPGLVIDFKHWVIL
jgi:hypothetical protein